MDARPPAPKRHDFIVGDDLDAHLQKSPCYPLYSLMVDCRVAQDVPQWLPCQKQLLDWRACMDKEREKERNENVPAAPKK
jgi:hypothetical protein